VNVRVKFYSIEGATVYNAAYSANLDLETLCLLRFIKWKFCYICFKLYLLGAPPKHCRLFCECSRQIFFHKRRHHLRCCLFSKFGPWNAFFHYVL